MDATIYGSYEVVSLPDLGIQNELAKIDTGAYSGAVHCTDIKLVRRGAHRKRYLKFTPLGDPALATETDIFEKAWVRSATGHKVKRYIIDATITIKDKTYPIRIGLANRSDMQRSVLIGRKFLRDNGILVDVRLNQEHDEGEIR